MAAAKTTRSTPGICHYGISFAGIFERAGGCGEGHADVPDSRRCGDRRRRYLRLRQGGACDAEAREEAAKERVYSLLPDDQKQTLSAIFDEFEADETPEAHFAHTMDNLQPLLLNNSNGGSDWADHDVTAKQVYGRQSRTEKGSAYLYELTDKILQANIEKGALKEK